MKILLSLFFSVSAFATELNCQIAESLTPVLKVRVNTQAMQKTLIGKTQDITAYVTEKADKSFSVEAFLHSAEIRIYADGPIQASGQKLTASYWSRDSLYDIQCSLP